ncbi:hypothetical protein [uncultured Sulfuricurvum sp.]|uniref:hypothetical protein n=1 Tax=uncultured Sulfuricurvum sp. TaxID=430693 RepID=UPI002613A954|nr:hypothetical protein [uncultured Sulfuricurvum sp.]
MADGYYHFFLSKMTSSYSFEGAITTLRNFHTKNEIKNYLNKLYKIPQYKKYICDEPFPSTIEKLKNKSRSITYDLENALFWEASVIKLFSAELNDFLDLKRQYVVKFLKSEFKEAELILNDIQNRFGYSLWLLENRIIFLDKTVGLKAQKEFMSDIVQDKKNDGLLQILIEYISTRTEKNINSDKFEDYIATLYKNISKYENTEGYIDYLSFKLKTFSIYPIKNYLNVLINETNSSIIDRYNTFLSVCQHLFSIEENEVLISSLKVLEKTIDDPYLKKLMYFTKVTQKFNYDDLSDQVNNVFEDYTKGEYQQCIQKSKLILVDNPFLIDVAEIYVKSHIRMNSDIESVNNDLLDEILLNMKNVIVKNSRSQEAYKNLYKLTYTYASQNWSNQIYNFLQNEFHDDNNRTVHQNNILGKLNDVVFLPKAIELLKTFESKNEYLEKLELLYQCPKMIQLFKSNIDTKTKTEVKYDAILIPNERKMIYMGDSFIQEEEYQKALSIFNTLLVDSNDILYRQKALIGKIRSLIRSDMLEETINIIVNEYFHNPYIYVIFPLKEIIDLFDLEEISDKKNTYLYLCIIYDIYLNNLNKDKFKFLDLQDLYEDFLFENNFETPAMLKSVIGMYEKEKMIYFLNHICIPSIMDSSPEFSSTNQIMEERIKICQILTEIDSKNLEEYQDEIKEYTSRLMLNKKVAEIEQSKIYVDIDGIKKSQEVKLKEAYERYISLEEIDNGDEEFIQFEIDDTQTLMIPTQDRRILLFKILFDLRDQFVLSSEYGLDTYLSVNIRHGTLTGMLRKPLEQEKIVTLKDEKTNIYIDNIHWKNNYKYVILEKTLEDIIGLLNEFSRKVDGLINKLKNEWIQIATEDKKTTGLFDYSLYIEEVKKVELKIENDLNYEEFVNILIDFLWEITEDNLKIIREKIQSEMIPEYISIFDELLKNLSELREIDKCHELIQAITRSRTEMQNTLTQISGWFKRTEIFNTQDYDILFALDVAQENIKNIYPHKTMILNKKADTYKLKGETFYSFVNVFITLLDNVIQRSKTDVYDVSIEISFNNEKNTIDLYCTNKINYTEQEIEENKLKIAQLVPSLNERKGMENVKKEGGTGFYKIIKILNVDLSCATKIDLKYLIGEENSQFFFTHITLQKEGLFYEYIDN